MYTGISTPAPEPSRFPAAPVIGYRNRQPATPFVQAALAERIDAGTTVFSEGDDAGNVYEVVEGVVRLYKLLADGRRQITGFRFAGDLLGFAPQTHYGYGAETVTKSKLRRFSRARFDRLVNDEPALAQRVLTVTFDELRSAQEQMLLLGRKSAAEKIASFLLKMAERQVDTLEVRLAMGRADIADYLGLTKETVCKTISELKRQGIIAASSASCIEICDRERLEDLAAGENPDIF